MKGTTGIISRKQTAEIRAAALGDVKKPLVARNNHLSGHCKIQIFILLQCSRHHLLVLHPLRVRSTSWPCVALEYRAMANGLR
ncbi:hypothetical protein NT6N_13640 [Oceaniferula spumae]|uniref:Uncharacterized protein n=1 Tax=Oceaniferula spumae TaxID=2979115 RepID=A0AAT9FK00_9BACT